MVNNWKPRHYHGGDKFKRTLQEAFGPYTDHTIHPTERPTFRRALPWILLSMFAAAFVTGAGYFAVQLMWAGI